MEVGQAVVVPPEPALPAEAHVAPQKPPHRACSPTPRLFLRTALVQVSCPAVWLWLCTACALCPNG